MFPKLLRISLCIITPLYSRILIILYYAYVYRCLSIYNTYINVSSNLRSMGPPLKRRSWVRRCWREIHTVAGVQRAVRVTTAIHSIASTGDVHVGLLPINE